MIILQSTQPFQLFTKIIKTEINTKVIKMQSLKGWVERPTGIIKKGRKFQHFKREYLDYGRECFIGANIQNISKSLLDNNWSLIIPLF
jgi:hypothetical protein